MTDGLGECVRAWRHARSGHWLRRSEVVGLAGAAIVVCAIALVLSLSGGGASHADSSTPTFAPPVPAHAAPPSANASAVANALRHGQLNVLLDDPSGAYAEQNRTIGRGAQIAAEELDAAGGLPGHVQINLVHQNLDGLSPSALQARLASDASGIVLLPCDTNSQLSLAAAAARYGTLMLAPCNYEPAAAERYASYWPVGAPASEELAELVDYMHAEGYLHAFIVDEPGSHYVEAVTNEFRQAAQAKQLRIVGTASIEGTGTDYNGLAQTIKHTEPSPSAVFTAVPPPTVNQLAAALKTQAVPVTLFATSVMDGPFAFTGGSSGLENTILGSYGFAREGRAARRFSNDYSNQFGRAPVGSFPVSDTKRSACSRKQRDKRTRRTRPVSSRRWRGASRCRASRSVNEATRRAPTTTRPRKWVSRRSRQELRTALRGVDATQPRGVSPGIVRALARRSASRRAKRHPQRAFSGHTDDV